MDANIDLEEQDDGCFYRVSINSSTDIVEVWKSNHSIKEIVSTIKYKSFSKLPNWLQEKVVLLRMVNINDDNRTLDGIGWRISPNIFWVYNGLL